MELLFLKKALFNQGNYQQNKKAMYRMEEDIYRFTFTLTSVRNQKEAANIGACWFSSRTLVCGHLTLSLLSCNCIKADSLYWKSNTGSFHQWPCFSHFKTLCYSFNSGFCLVELSLEISLTSFNPSSSYQLKKYVFSNTMMLFGLKFYSEHLFKTSNFSFNRV